jgi:tryptophan synthase beta chain
VRDFQSVIGRETREQMMAKEGRLPDTLVACIGGGSNAMGLFHPFLDDPAVAMVGVEAGGHGIATGSTPPRSPAAARRAARQPHLPAAGRGRADRRGALDLGRARLSRHRARASWLHDMKRVSYVSATDDEALEAFKFCAKLEGIIPALEPAHALAEVIKRAPKLPPTTCWS